MGEPRPKFEETEDIQRTKGISSLGLNSVRYNNSGLVEIEEPRPNNEETVNIQRTAEKITAILHGRTKGSLQSNSGFSSPGDSPTTYRRHSTGLQQPDSGFTSPAGSPTTYRRHNTGTPQPDRDRITLQSPQTRHFGPAPSFTTKSHHSYDDTMKATQRSHNTSVCEIQKKLSKFYENSPAFYQYRFHGLSHNCKFTFALVPLLRVIRFETAFTETETIVQCLQDALSPSQYNGDCVKHGHKYCTSCGFKFFKNVLLLAEDTSVPGNYFVYMWLREILNQPNNNGLFMSQFGAVLLLEITNIDDNTDVNKLISARFCLEDIQNANPKQLLIILECTFTAPAILRKTFEKIKDCGIPYCTFVIIANVAEAEISSLHITPERILLMSGIDFLHVSALDTQNIECDDGAIISKSVEQILTRQKDTFWKKHEIEQIYFEDFPEGFPTLLIKLSNCIGIKAIKARSCGQRFHLLHHAESLDVDTFVSLRNVTNAPFSSTLTTVTLTFAPHQYRHIFYKTFYEEFAIAICQIAKLRSIVLCDMIMGSEVLNINLEGKEIEMLKQSVISNDDYRRYGTRIIGPKIEVIPFSKRDVDIELNERNSFAAYVILDLICYELVKTNDEIVESYPARYDNDAEIVLVCFTKAKTPLTSFKGLSLVKREDGVVSKESLHAENSFDREENKCKKMMKKHFVDINETLSYHANSLMKNHTNVEALKVSFVKSSKGQFTCPYPNIVIFCKAKGYKPNGESNIPQTLKHPFKNRKYKTDVREGFFTSSPYLTRRSDERNEELSLGCSIGEISSDRGGTLGPLVHVRETGEICFLTARHLFAPLPPMRPDDQLLGAKVVQPSAIHLPPTARSHQNKLCGEVLVSQIGGQIDAALVKISPERQPSRVHFVNISREGLKFAGLSEKELPTFDDGAKLDAKALTVKDGATRRIIKIGTTTGLTKGTLSTTDGYVRETMEYGTLETLHNGNKETCVIKSQLLVDSYVKKVFCQAGDSGSAVFLVDDDNRLYCIGMVIGLIVNDCTAVVTPIQNILDILGHKLGKTLELKKFTFDEMDEN